MKKEKETIAETARLNIRGFNSSKSKTEKRNSTAVQYFDIFNEGSVRGMKLGDL